MTQLGGRSEQNRCSIAEAQEVKRGPEKKEGALHSTQPKILESLASREGERGGRRKRGKGTGDREEGRDEAGCWGGIQAPHQNVGAGRGQESGHWRGASKDHSHPERHCL